MMLRKTLEIREHAAGVYHVQYDHGFVYSSAADRFITRWDPHLGTQDKFAIRFDESVFRFLVHNDVLLAGTASGDLHFFDLNERSEIKHFTNHRSAIFSMVLDEEGDHVFVGDAEGILSVWRWSTCEFRAELPMDCGKIRRISVDPHGDLFAVCAQDGSLRIFDTSFFNEIHSLKAHAGGTTAALFHPNQKDLIFTGGKDAFLRLWNYKTGQLISSVPAHNFVIYDLIELNNGKTLISSSRDKTIKIFDLDSMSFLQRLDLKEGGHRHSVNCLLKMSENTFASASDDKRMIVWEGE